jgi:hypothetical protein
VAAFVGGYEALVIVGLATVPLVASVLLAATLSRREREKPPSLLTVLANVNGSKVAAVLLGIIIIIEIGALARWISYPASDTEIYGDPSWMLAELESALFHSFGLLSPVLVSLIAFSFFFKWFMPDLLRKVTDIVAPQHSIGKGKVAPLNKVRHNVDHVNETIKRETEVLERDKSLVVRRTPLKSTTTTELVPKAILIAALVVSPLLMIYPHLPGVNPSGGGVSVDELYYMNWMSQLRLVQDEGPLSVIASVFIINNGDRPFTLLLIKTIADLTASEDIMVIRYLPVALAPMLVMANYGLIRLALKSRQDQRSVKLFASIGAMVAAFAPQIVVGEYAGLLANWLALIPAYFALYLLIRCWESKDRRQAIMYSAGLFGIMMLILLIHLYTWSHLLAVALVFVILSYAFSRRTSVSPKTKVLVILLVICSTFAVDYGRSLYFSTPSATSADSAITKNIQPTGQGMSRWDQLYFTLGAFVGGYLSNPMLFLMALFWVVAKADFAQGLDRVMLAMLFMLAPPVLFGTVEFQTRVLFNTMIQIPALLAIYSFSSRSRNGLLRTMLIVAVIAVMATYGIRAMANLYLELPEGIGLETEFLLP